MKNFLYLFLICTFFISSCKKDERLPEEESTGAPMPISNPIVENLAGSAKITYTLPPNRDLLYVKAVYEANGRQREAKTSLFENTITVDGFGDTKERVVQLYAVNRSEESSAPVSVTVKPLDPPVITVKNSITTVSDFGGLSLFFDNLTEAELSIHVLTKNEQGDFVPAESVGGTASVLYTKRLNGVFAVRGFNTDTRQFAIYVKDRWGNESERVEVEVNPLFEKEIDRTKFLDFPLASDAAYVSGWNVPKMFDNSLNDVTYHTVVGSGIPSSFTINLQKMVKLSRIKTWQRGVPYNAANVRKFELWGAVNPPTDSYTTWTLIGTFESIKPSGSPTGVNTAEDGAWAAAGEEFVMPTGTPAYQYLRFKTTETWGRQNYVHIAEIKFFGQD